MRTILNNMCAAMTAIIKSDYRSFFPLMYFWIPLQAEISDFISRYVLISNSRFDWLFLALVSPECNISVSTYLIH